MDLPHKSQPTASESHQSAENIPQISSIEEEKFIAIMRQIEGNSLTNLSESHITEVLEQRRKIAEYVHSENMQDHERFKISQNNSLIQLGILLLFALIVLGLVAYVDKSYFPQSLTLLFGFISGFGVGKTMRDSTSRK